jgi:hypothetical protein
MSRKEETADGGKTFSECTNQLSTELWNLAEVEVLDNTGKIIKKAELPNLLKNETLALVYAGPDKLDPLNLRVIKDGVLIFSIHHVAPAGVAVPPPAFVPFPPPAAPAPLPPADDKLNRHAERPVKLGEWRLLNIVIVGNDKTPDKVILEALPFKPGQVVRPDDLKKAERNLERLNLFQVNPKEGVRPRVTFLENSGDGTCFKDILVIVKENGEAGRN